ncbi:MAG: 2TM domain-containing protein [Sedimenticola sp.]|nr:2TM domain-containing protein [Sedimenticola sp.]
MSDQENENWLKQKRLERAWSQEQLADISGLSTRTIQRVEQGGTASLETLKSIASAFDTDVSLLQSRAENAAPLVEATSTLAVEQESMSASDNRENRIAKFHRHLIIYLVVNPGLFLIDIMTSSDSLWFYYPLFFWGIAIAIKGFLAYGLPDRGKKGLVH